MRLFALYLIWLLLFLGPGAVPVFAEELTSYGARGRAGSGSTAGTLIMGSVAAGPAKAEVMPLSLREAMQLGLTNNLGLLLRQEGIRSAKGQQWAELRKLLPNLSGEGSVHRLKENLAITGISLPGVPTVVGPFNYYDLRLSLSQRLFDLEAINRSRAAGYDLTAAELSVQDARELVVVVVGAAYLQALAGQARVETIRTQVRTARVILDRAVQMHREGISPGIDELRSRVEYLSRQQQLIVAENTLAKDKLTLIRLIGLPVGQGVELIDSASFEPSRTADLDILLSRAFTARHDYQVVENQVKSAEASHGAARSQRLPSLVLNADYGATGLTPSSLKETYHVIGSITVPLFLGGKIHGDVLSAEALLRQRQDERDDLRSRIEFQVRTALLDVAAAEKQVTVAKESVDLAELALSQAHERFTAGITDNLEVVQAQQSVATAHEAFISGLYQHNLAKLLLARATGVAEELAAGGGR